MEPGHTLSPIDCRTASEVLAKIGDKWTVQIVSLLRAGAKRFSVIKREVAGIRFDAANGARA